MTCPLSGSDSYGGTFANDFYIITYFVSVSGVQSTQFCSSVEKKSENVVYEPNLRFSTLVSNAKIA